MHGQAATRRAEAADHHRRRIRNLARRNLTEAEPARLAHELSRQPALLRVNHGLEATQQRFTPANGLHEGSPPGIFGRVTARKNKMRSIDSPPIENGKVRTAASAAIPTVAKAVPSIASKGSSTPPEKPSTSLSVPCPFRGPRSSRAVSRNGSEPMSCLFATVARLVHELGRRHE